MELTIRGKLHKDPEREIIATLRDGTITAEDDVLEALEQVRQRLAAGAVIAVVPSRKLTGVDAILTPEGFWAACLEFMWPISEMIGDIPDIPPLPEGAWG